MDTDSNRKKFDLLEPETSQVDPEDIIAALPFIPCFTGQQAASRHEFAYSVGN